MLDLSLGVDMRKYGWLPDPTDDRDHRFAALAHVVEALPSSVDMRPKCPPVWDQGSLGSCTAHAVNAAIEFHRAGHALPLSMPSRLFTYYNERLLEGSTDEDSGAYLRDGIKALARWGVCGENLWPYDDQLLRTAPDAAAYGDALRTRVVAYKRLAQRVDDLRACLAQGIPFVFGFQVYESFESEGVARSGTANMPRGNDELLGGHAVMAVGYNWRTKRFTVRNSWGSGWGNHGYFTLPYEYLVSADLSSDFWAVTEVSCQ